jgi:hypothetical protein
MFIVASILMLSVTFKVQFTIPDVALAVVRAGPGEADSHRGAYASIVVMATILNYRT